MGCSSCGVTSEDGEVKGCQNNGGCSSGGCNKLNVFDWLSHMEKPIEQHFDIVEVRFKNGHKEFFRNNQNLDLVTGDAVMVDVPNGHHLGHVSLQGELVRLQMRKKKVKNDDEIRVIYRIASQRDLEKYREVKNREMPTLYRTRQIIEDLKLGMKLTDVEFQADNTKATFYYSAEDRVDFRELIKKLAGEFRIRVEMRQISLRQEASRLGGIGSCGRELCCSTWLSEFKSVGTQAARYQNLSLNPSKLSGQCGRLKCCLNYELDTYMDALNEIPKIEKPLLTEKGSARLQKTDIFRKIMWFGYDDENSWYPLDTDRVNEILALNKEGKKPVSLLLDEEEQEVDNGILNSDLEAMDKKFSGGNKNKKRKKKKFNKNRNHNTGAKTQEQSPKQNSPLGQNENQPQNKGQGQHRPKNKRRNKNRNKNQNQNQGPKNDKPAS
ncbi:MAG: regulatory iron-sulfur-containing complex subunit RicT [Cyclobacteriaceae bacterium]